MNYLVSGSFAYDTILSFNGKLQTQILPESIARLNVSFLINRVQDEFGGTGGNIAYNASLLDDNPLVLGVLGQEDSLPYLKHLQKININLTGLTVIENERSAHAWILTDSDNNQITSFSMGAMQHPSKIPDNTPNIWHLAPENPLTTALLAKTALERKQEYFFDPGQCLPVFTTGITDSVFSLDDIIANAKGVFVNDYEWELLANYKKIGSPLDFLKSDQFLVRTLGSNGVDFFHNGKEIHFDVVATNSIVDPTGCGDAFRSGFLYAYTRKKSLENCVRLGTVMGHYAIQCSGGQNHHVELNTILTMWKQIYVDD